MSTIPFGTSPLSRGCSQFGSLLLTSRAFSLKINYAFSSTTHSFEFTVSCLLLISKEIAPLLSLAAPFLQFTSETASDCSLFKEFRSLQTQSLRIAFHGPLCSSWSLPSLGRQATYSTQLLIPQSGSRELRGSYGWLPLKTCSHFRGRLRSQFLLFPGGVLSSPFSTLSLCSCSG